MRGLGSRTSATRQMAFDECKSGGDGSKAIALAILHLADVIGKVQR